MRAVICGLLAVVDELLEAYERATPSIDQKLVGRVLTSIHLTRMLLNSETRGLTWLKF